MIGTLLKTRRQWQRERQQTKDVMSKTMVVHERYNSRYILLPSSAKQRRENQILPCLEKVNHNTYD